MRWCGPGAAVRFMVGQGPELEWGGVDCCGDEAKQVGTDTPHWCSVGDPGSGAAVLCCKHTPGGATAA